MKTCLQRLAALVLGLSIVLSTAVYAAAATYPYTTQSGDSVKLRKYANTTSVVLATINAGDSVTVLEKSGKFYKVQYNKLTGYAMVEFIDGTGEGSVPTTSQEALTAITKYPYDTNTIARVKLRKAANETAAVHQVIPEDELVTVYEVTSNGFAKVKYKGKTGYVMTAYIVLANIPTPTPLPSTTISPEATKYTSLKSGDKGSHVRALQEALTELGFYTGKVDSKFGAGSKTAVMAFEKRNALDEDGVADSALQLLLYEGKPKNSKGIRKTIKTLPLVGGVTIKSGNTGEVVEKFQTRLKELGYYTADINGVCDKATVNALKAFQKKMGLTADGIATADVQTILNGATALTAAEVVIVTPTPSPTLVAPTDTLRSGDKGNAVKTVQQRLTDLGYYTGKIDSKYTDETIAAVKEFQKKNNLKQDGVFGLLTSAVMFASNPIYAVATVQPMPAVTPTLLITPDTVVTIKAGSRGSVVLSLQTRLTELGYYTSRLDGVYLEDDITAVRSFQKANSLSVDGKAGYQTQLALYSGTAVRGDLNVTGSSRTLRYKDTGEDVTVLQNRLIELGYLVGVADGNFGTATRTAVVSFQKASSLTRDGVAGSKTQDLLYSNTATKNKVSTAKTLKPGTISDEVRILQERLITLGYLSGGADGNFGAKTSMALIAFQKQNGLTADGIAGSKTLVKLNSTSAKASNGNSSDTTSSAPPTLTNAPNASSVRYANWYSEVRERCRMYPNVTVYDFVSGISWRINLFSNGAHADGDPMTAEDTANMQKAFGGKTTWTPKAVWVVFSDGRVYMASTHDTPHGTYHNKVNNFAGHICIHFPRTADQVASIGPYATSHQKAIDLGWAATMARIGR